VQACPNTHVGENTTVRAEGAELVARASVRHRRIRQRSKVRRPVARLSRQNAVGDRSKPPLESIEMR